LIQKKRTKEKSSPVETLEKITLHFLKSQNDCVKIYIQVGFLTKSSVDFLPRLFQWTFFRLNF